MVVRTRCPYDVTTMVAVESRVRGNYEVCTASPTPGYEDVKNAAVAFVERMKIGTEVGVYAKEPGGEASLYGSYHGLHVLDLFGVAPTEKETRREWAQIFKRLQTEWGYFSPRPTSEKGRSPYEMDPVWHYTRGNIWALRLLGEKPENPFSFLEPFFDSGYTYEYVKRYDWSNSWAAGNQICALATAMQGARDWFGESQVDDILSKEMYPALEEIIDPETGYWGTQLGADIWNAQFGTIHVLPIYFTQNWPVRFLDSSVDTTIRTQLDDGSFWPAGSDCPDFDGAYMLLNLARLTDYRADDVRASARKYLDHALMHRDPDGVGWRLHRRDSTPEQWKSRPHWIWKEGADTVSAEYRDEDPARTHIMLGSWFYPLSIALVTMVLGDSGYEGPYQLNRMSLHQANVVNAQGVTKG